MKFHGAPLLFTPVLLLFITALFSCSFALEFNRGSFPAGFIFGAASSAYQVSRRILETSQLSFENIIMCLQYEGAAREGGRGPSIWDTFTHKHPERIADGSNGDIAIDHYHHYKEDIKLMKNIGLDAYRFSISWSRIFPNGSLSGGVNKEGINHYNKFIDELILNGVQPFVTLFHFDSPQGLEQKYGSFLSPNIVNDFRNYAEICFREFGDRVKHWITFNEPWSFAVGGYAEGFLAPARCSPWESTKCDEGDSGREPYIVAHNLLIAHASAVKLYRNKYKARQKGKIGIILVSNWFVPYSNTKSNRDASERALDFMFGWFMDPLTTGDYPFIMRVLVGSRLPKYTEEESKLVKGSYDFIGLNYYTTNYVDNLPALNMMNKTYTTDSCLNKTGMRNGIQIGPRAASSWLYIYPRGIRDLLLYINAKYNHPVIYITENGVDEVSNGTLSLEEALKDDARIDFHQRHLYYIQRAIRNGADVRGYFAWSLLDNFEWMDGFTVRFGINYVAYNDGLKRYPKNSALWFKKFLKR